MQIGRDPHSQLSRRRHRHSGSCSGGRGLQAGATQLGLAFRPQEPAGVQLWLQERGWTSGQGRRESWAGCRTRYAALGTRLSLWEQLRRKSDEAAGALLPALCQLPMSCRQAPGGRPWARFPAAARRRVAGVAHQHSLADTPGLHGNSKAAQWRVQVGACGTAAVRCVAVPGSVRQCPACSRKRGRIPIAWSCCLQQGGRCMWS